MIVLPRKSPIANPAIIKKTSQFSGILFRHFLKRLPFAVAALAFVGVSQAGAADGTWNVDAAGLWSDPGNWASGTIPGTTSGTTSSDIATFSQTLTVARTVTVDANRNVAGITLNNSSAFGYSLGSGAISLSNGGVISSVTTNGAHLDFVNSTIFIQGDGGSAAITNNATSTSNRLIIGSGGIQGSSTGTNTTTLTLNGSNIAANAVSNAITDGSGGGKLALIKNDVGNWRLQGANTFSGGVTLNAGQMGFSSNATAFGSGTLTINGGILESSNAAADTTYTNKIAVGGDFTVRDASVNAFLKTFSGAMDLGGSSRTITASTAGSDFIFSGIISNGGLTKAGADSLTLSGVNTYTSDTTVSAGTLLLADNSQTSFVIGANGVNNKILGTGTISLDGDFSFDLSGAGVNLADSWNIVNVGTLTETFGGTFNVLGFADIGGNLWEKSGVNGGRTYQFDEASGNLSVTAVPEPSTLAFLALGLSAVVAFRRRRI